MIIETTSDLMLIGEEEISVKAQELLPQEIERLVEWLDLKEDKVRYQAFLLLQAKSRKDSGVYSFWEVFHSKLTNSNSYQRSLGIMLIAENVQWDTEHKMMNTITDYLKCLNDEKPITIRQCIQALKLIVQKVPNYNKEIMEGLLAFDIMIIRESMRKVIMCDLIDTLLEIRKHEKHEDIDTFIFQALTGEVLDEKSKKQIKKKL